MKAFYNGESLDIDINEELLKISSLSYEELYTKLELISSILSNGKLELEDSVRLYELGVTISERMEKLLLDAESKIMKIDKRTNEEIPFEEN